MTSTPTYLMRLDLNVLNHLGMRLYSNVAAVLSEAVANSWDADAPSVDITLDVASGFIEVEDSGKGMSIADVNDRFLTVGYDKRKDEGSKSKGGRTLMGRKGIGKLSLFSVAETVKVVSVKDGVKHGFVMSVPAIEAAIKAKRDYHPERLPDAALPPVTRGTWIRLENLKKRAGSQTINALRKRLARRFAILGKGFDVSINGNPITAADRDDLSKCQFLWQFNSPTLLDPSSTAHIQKSATLPEYVSVEGRAYAVRGWIGSARKPRDLDGPETGNLNSIVVFARGRLIQENILDRVNVGGLFTKYLTGQVEADFLDLDEQEDIATSDRQRVIEDDSRYRGLVEYILSTLNRIEPMWAEWRAEFGTREVVENYPKIAAWIEALPAKSRVHARRVIGSIQGLSIDDEAKRRDLLRHGLMAFERLRLTESTNELAKMVETNAEDLLPLIGESDQLEAAMYLDIVRNRLNVIKRFMDIVDNNGRERVLQELLFEHLWLLDPSWERAAGSERMEERITKEFAGIDAELDEDEKRGRLDIKYRTMAGKHVIIELKRSKVVPSVFALAEQGEKYRSATKKFLQEAGRGHEPVEVIFVLGGGTLQDGETTAKTVQAINGRIVTHEALIQGAIQSYQEYVEKRKKLDVIEGLLQSDTLSDMGDTAAVGAGD